MFTSRLIGKTAIKGTRIVAFCCDTLVPRVEFRAEFLRGGCIVSTTCSDKWTNFTELLSV
jgi:hypothetical protein